MHVLNYIEPVENEIIMYIHYLMQGVKILSK
jgi:hypothetical protein